MDSTELKSQIALGNHYNVTPSEAFQGIVAGTVVVHALARDCNIGVPEDEVYGYTEGLEPAEQCDLRTDWWVLVQYEDDPGMPDYFWMPISILAYHIVD